MFCEIWCSQGDEDVDGSLLGSHAVWTCRWEPTYSWNIMPSSSGPKLEMGGGGGSSVVVEYTAHIFSDKVGGSLFLRNVIQTYMSNFGSEDGCSMFHRNVSTTMSTRRHNPEDYNRQNTYCAIFSTNASRNKTRQKRAVRQVDAALVHACMRAGGQKSLIRAVSQSGDVGRATSEIVWGRETRSGMCFHCNVAVSTARSGMLKAKPQRSL
jgi:hypothetical protein